MRVKKKLWGKYYGLYWICVESCLSLIFGNIYLAELLFERWCEIFKFYPNSGIRSLKNAYMTALSFMYKSLGHPHKVRWLSKQIYPTMSYLKKVPSKQRGTSKCLQFKT